MEGADEVGATCPVVTSRTTRPSLPEGRCREGRLREKQRVSEQALEGRERGRTCAGGREGDDAALGINCLAVGEKVE